MKGTDLEKPEVAESYNSIALPSSAGIVRAHQLLLLQEH